MSTNSININVSKAEVCQLNLLFSLHGQSILPNKDLGRLVEEINKAYMELELKNIKETRNRKTKEDSENFCL